MTRSSLLTLLLALSLAGALYSQHQSGLETERLRSALESRDTEVAQLKKRLSNETLRLKDQVAKLQTELTTEQSTQASLLIRSRSMTQVRDQAPELLASRWQLQ